MPYMKLQIKRVVKSKFTWLSLLAILLACFYFWNLDYNISNRETNELQTAKGNLVIQKKNIKYYQKALKKPHLNSKNKKELTVDLADNKKLAQDNQTIIAALEANNWNKAYPLLIKQAKFWLVDAKSNFTNSQNLAITKRDLKQLQLLARDKIPKEFEYASVKGGFFTLQMIRETMPLLAVLAVIFILTKLYSSSYFERMRLGNLLPQRGLVLTQFTSGALIGFSYFLLIVLIIFIVPSIFFGTGSLNYPMAGMNAVAKEYTFTPLYQLALPVLFLSLLNFIFIAAAVLLIVQVFKQQLLALFIAALVLGGGMVLPQYVVGFRSFAQFFPTSYLFPLQPIDGTFGISNAYVFANETQLVTYPKVTLATGVVVLMLWTTALMILNYLLARRMENGRKIK